MNRREFHQRLRFLLSREHTERMLALAKMSAQEQREFRHVWRIHARKAQVAPDGEWRTWLILAGRGFGKTRAGAEWVREVAEADPAVRIALVGANLGEARSVMVEGESGLLAVCPPGRKPVFEPSLRKLTWPNGAEATLFSAGEPESLRGPQHGFACRPGAERRLRQRIAGSHRRAAAWRDRERNRNSAHLAA
jgi:phage terminase large subunit-like protein